MKRVFISFFISAVVGFCIGGLAAPDERFLRVVFLDVGQGDAIFIESPTGAQVLIDGGPNASVLRELGKQMSFFDREIDLVIATHPDKDHIAGLPHVFDRYDIDLFGTTTATNETIYDEALDEAVRTEEGLVVIPLVRGERIDLGGGAVLEILFPDRNVSGLSANDGSVIVRLVHDDVSFMLTGDAPVSIEDYLVETSCDGCLRATVLKAGHHGSKTSTSTLFLGAVSPEVVVFSAGENNRYGHPALEIIERVESFGATWFGTHIDGSIIFESDGERVWRK